jgi:hypothetical protein
MDWGKLTTYLQLTGAALAIPAAAGGAYSVYQNYFTNDLACQKLRTSIVATMERHIAIEVKRTLLRKDVTEFVKNCGHADPDAKVLFEASLEDTKFAAPSGAPPASNAVVSATPSAGAGMTPDGLPVSVVMSFGRSPTGDVRGWVALTRGEASRIGEPNFDGHELSLTVVPPFGTILRARQTMPVWMEPQANSNDSNKLQGRVPVGSCVRIISTRTSEGRGRNWGEVAPAPCTPTLRAGGPTTGPLANMSASALPPEGFATGQGGERRGWVALSPRKADSANVNFDGFTITESALPPAGTVLTARWPLPIWNEAQGQAPNNLQHAQGRLAARECVRVVGSRAGPDRLWAEVVPAAC